MRTVLPITVRDTALQRRLRRVDDVLVPAGHEEGGRETSLRFQVEGFDGVCGGVAGEGSGRELEEWGSRFGDRVEL